MTSTRHDTTGQPARFKVLLVDDEEDIRELLGMLLDDLGFAVRTAANGAEALDAFRLDRPDIVLTDIKMPGMDGIELLGAIKALDQDVEVIMISGHGDMGLAIESLKLSAADFITKPIDDDLLSIALDKVVERLTLRRQVREHTEELERLVAEKSARVVELERQSAARQIMGGLSSAMSVVAGDLDDSGVFNELPCFISIHCADQRVVAANTLYEQRLGGRTGQPSRAVYKDHSGPGECPVADAVAQGAGGRASATLLAADGGEIPAVVSTAPILDSDGAVSMVLEVAVDITEVNRLRSELTRTQRRYEHLFNQVPCYITVQDRDMRIVEANDRFRQDFGFGRGPTCHQAYKNLGEVCDDCPVQKTFSDGGRHQRETVVTSRSGRSHNILVWTAPLFNEHGQVDHVLEVATDITTVRELQDQLTSLGMMLGSMSHGVKGLLAALDGGIYRVDSGLAKGDAARVDAGWKVVKHRIGHMKKMVMDILYYAKSRELTVSAATLGDFASDLAAAVEAKATQHGVALVRDFADTDAFFEADTEALAPALLNFLENAVDACVFDRAKADHAVTFGVSAENGHIVFDIADNGTGMDRETRENMFTLFFSSKGANGTGIGLFISNQVIARHHGSIEVNSAVGQGTHFRIRIPAGQTSPDAGGTRTDAALG
ncbi:response regulator [Pseudodesulfovibrio pelocollis]|uniref:response regulator n=1 Tax=Pseudodesulfovibrio pelocollis TaxID=3051432 RepID=UPI00255AB2E3|nr:response regulator [Pseudodesulfovibrio sp. SB368]